METILQIPYGIKRCKIGIGNCDRGAEILVSLAKAKTEMYGKQTTRVTEFWCCLLCRTANLVYLYESQGSLRPPVNHN